MDAFWEGRDGRGWGGCVRREGEGLGWKGKEKERMAVVDVVDGCQRGRRGFVLERTTFCGLHALRIFISFSLSLSICVFLSLYFRLSLSVVSCVPPRFVL